MEKYCSDSKNNETNNISNIKDSKDNLEKNKNNNIQTTKNIKIDLKKNLVKKRTKNAKLKNSNKRKIKIKNYPKLFNKSNKPLVESVIISIKFNKINNIFISGEYYNKKTKDNSILIIKEKKIVTKQQISYPKKRKLFGEWLNSDKYNLKISNCKNSFIKKYEQILEDISYFSNNPPKFLSHIVMIIKNEISYFGQILINKSIINSENYQLTNLDYDRFVKILSKDFNDKNLFKKLDEIFIEFQAKNEGNLRNNNKKVIQYIRNNYLNEIIANEYLDLTFFELFDLFNETHLKDFINEIKKELELEYKNNSLTDTLIKEKIEAFVNIIDIICKNYKDYFELIDERKN